MHLHRYVYVNMYISTCVLHVDRFILVWAHAYASVKPDMHVCVCVDMHLHVSAHEHMHVYVCLCMHACILLSIPTKHLRES